MAEIEISVLTNQCLDRRVSTLEGVPRPAVAWSRDRNRRKATIDWTFNKADTCGVFPEPYRHKHAG